MKRIQKHILIAQIIFAVLVIMLLTAILPAQQSEPNSESNQVRINWIKDNAVPVRTIDPNDEDYSDLMPLVEKIGAARIVQLGEGSHGSGSAFKAKTRLIKFLHKVMGFEVLVWESGLYDCREFNTALRAGKDPIAAARLGVFGIWILEETKPLFTYAQESFATDRPLAMAGFDEQFSSLNAAARFSEDLAVFLDSMGSDWPEENVRNTFAAIMEKTAKRELALEDQALLTGAIEAIEAAIKQQMPQLQSHHGRLEIEFFQRALTNLKVFTLSMAERYDAQQKKEQYSPNDSWNARDRQNGANMLWLADEYFRGKKLIVWAHNGHIMNCVYKPDWRSLSHDKQDAGMIPVGLYLDEALGDQVYTVGFIGYKGSHGRRGADLAEIGSFPEDALESLCAKTGNPHMFIDFRHLDKIKDHWLHRPFKMGIRSYFAEEMLDCTRVYDAVFYNEIITPGTPIKNPEDKK